jgi:hypothetical protein
MSQTAVRMLLQLLLQAACPCLRLMSSLALTRVRRAARRLTLKPQSSRVLLQLLHHHQQQQGRMLGPLVGLMEGRTSSRGRRGLSSSSRRLLLLLMLRDRTRPLLTSSSKARRVLLLRQGQLQLANPTSSSSSRVRVVVM